MRRGAREGARGRPQVGRGAWRSPPEDARPHRWRPRRNHSPRAAWSGHHRWPHGGRGGGGKRSARPPRSRRGCARPPVGSCVRPSPASSSA